MRVIAENAGQEGSVVVENVRTERQGPRTTATTRATTSTATCSKAGIIDPAKVTRSALENAASIAAMVLTTETLVTDIPEPPSPPRRRRRWTTRASVSDQWQLREARRRDGPFLLLRICRQ